jgi:tetratricopeptide (TPR) repeat protein
LFPALLAVVIFAGEISIETLGDDFKTHLAPYKKWVWVTCGLAVLAAIILAIRDARQPNEPTIITPPNPPDTTLKQEGSHNIGLQQVTNSPITININNAPNPQPESVPNAQSEILNQQSAIKLTLPPPLTPHLFGRDDELQLLDEAWANPATKIVVFHALGGAGKSALVWKWLAQMAKKDYDGAQRVFGWSFFSQGSSENRSDSSEAFIDSALAFFGVTVEGDYFRKADRLAEALRAERTVLILDGLEPLQYPPNTAGLPEGGLKDRALQTILLHLAAQQPGLCIITSRERLSDLNGYDEATVIQRPLDHLPYQTATGEQPCAQLLRALGVTGDDAEMLAAAQEFKGHAYALTLLGSYLAEVLGGDLRRRKDIVNLFDDDRFGSQADRMIAAYETWLGAGVEVAILRLLGLFDRPAEAASIAALRAAPAVPGLTETLQGLSEVKWQQALSRLRRIYLLSPANAPAPHELDAHPLVREHFRQQLKAHAPDAWRAGNLRLYEHLTRTAKDLPDTLAEMQPLLAAVTHGCATGKVKETYDNVYRQRISRGEEEFIVMKLGAYGEALAALWNFIEGTRDQSAARLTNADRAEIFNDMGFHLRGLGRLTEAVSPLQAGLTIRLSQEDWYNASINVGNLSEIYVDIGNLSQALTSAQQGVELADHSGDSFRRLDDRALLAHVLHQCGRLGEAKALFYMAEWINKKHTPTLPLLYSMPGYWYCDLLLDQGKAYDVRIRATKMIKIATEELWLLATALSNLLLGRAWLLQSRHQNNAMTQAAFFLQCAIDSLRQARTMHHLPLGLLARAAWARVAQQFDQAHRDLAEARSIAERSEMRLHLCDYHLEAARLHLAQGQPDEARDHWATAREMVAEMDYHRRDAEVAAIAKELGIDGG